MELTELNQYDRYMEEQQKRAEDVVNTMSALLKIMREATSAAADELKKLEMEFVKK